MNERTRRRTHAIFVDRIQYGEIRIKPGCYDDSNHFGGPPGQFVCPSDHVDVTLLVTQKEFDSLDICF